MVLGLRRGPLALAVGACVLLAVSGGALVGDALETWFARLEKPWWLVLLWAFYVVAVLYYLTFATVLYRIVVRVEDREARAVCLSLALLVMVSNELWNFLFFGLRSTLAGFVGIVLFLVPLAVLVAVLLRCETVSGVLLVPYCLWVLYDLAWTFELWRLNGGA